ncbi:GTPase activating protein 1 isoform X1 [Brachypodium distachyon]|uniref:C2 domain-containing protein n=1 Tax=Brachypodium distachyon TaxID=15368 RepID=A0A2K2CWH6_BRADI|nr:GTPase activating protein 1 isoform X1 [Brachypodium distachyon]PNT66378.1 hypothetical protein BRADI_3g10810v3 [Brachypodium distachyon]|eukprot:XP_024318060.1 GTPase activating protein 1 isoform X1 [Brachypodium distachyon]
MLGHLVGLVKVRVLRGVNLAIRDLCSSDPYVVIRMGKQVNFRFRTSSSSSSSQFLVRCPDATAALIRLVCRFSGFYFLWWKEKLKTRVIKKTTNPEWNDELTLSIEDPEVPIRLDVFDKDTFIDDAMGNAELDIQPLVEVVKMKLQGVPENTVVKKLVPNRQNCLAEESAIRISEGAVKQDMVLRLRNVECGEIELQLEWIDIPGSKGV